ncbi:MAG: flagellar basal body P-ring formation protein FlgA [Proteobacteria bacterium]|nr:flagellar basal body P-ring formation protein FlgA [Pseudomonadota bacterium]
MRHTIIFIIMLAALPWLSRADDTQLAMLSVPVLKSPVQRGETISADNIMEKQVPADQVYAGTVDNAAQLAGLEALRPLQADTPINKLHVRVAPDIARGSLVDIRYTRGAVQLSVKGQALQDGTIGQSIKVLNPSTRTTLVGIVAANATVDIN